MKKLLVLFLSVFMLFSVVACSADSTSDASGEEVTLSVYAAASLTEAFTDIAAAYEEENPDVTVELNFAGSQALTTQIEEGGYADVFASANTKYMDQLTEEGYIESSELFAGNKLVIVVNNDSVDKVQTIEDLAADDVSLAIAESSVPVGKYSQTFLDNLTEAGTYGDTFNEEVMANVVSSDLTVKDVLSKVELGEVDAGIVYTSDYVSADQDAVTTVEIEDDINVAAEYPIGTLAESENTETAQSFVDYVLSESGQSILSDYGFIVD
jgi:molybdate transport system substrate-binding protein